MTISLGAILFQSDLFSLLSISFSFSFTLSAISLSSRRFSLIVTGFGGVFDDMM